VLLGDTAHRRIAPLIDADRKHAQPSRATLTTQPLEVGQFLLTRDAPRRPPACVLPQHLQQRAKAVRHGCQRADAGPI
jgi:hypothetical protein